MLRPKSYIVFTIGYSGKDYSIRTYWHEHRDLRALIKEKLKLGGFGQCGGLGRCGTCLVHVGQNLKDGDNTPKGYKALACHLPISDDLSNAFITILKVM
jgi:ferredoxin, 2Fe-2S